MPKDDKKTNRQTKNVCNRTVKTTHKTAVFVTKNFHAVRILWVLKNKTLAGDVDGEKQNETGYELSRGTFVVTDFTRHNLMDGSVSAGNDLEMIQIKGTMWAEEGSRRICLTSPCILSSFLRRHGIKKQWTEIEENINCKGSYKSIFSAFRNPKKLDPIFILFTLFFFNRITRHKYPTTMTVCTYGWIVGWSIGCQREHRAMNWKKQRGNLDVNLSE